MDNHKMLINKLRNGIKTKLKEVFETEPNILYLHGLGSSPEEDQVKSLTGAKIYAPTLDYDNKLLFDKILKICKEKNFQAVIGHSMGGFMAYYISYKLNIPCLLFNPAFNDVDAEMYKIPKSIENKKSKLKNQLAIVGIKDDVVPMKNQLDFLNDTECKIIKIDIGHDIPLKIKKKYFKKFIETYI